MKATLMTPDFQSETAAAEWYDANEDKLLAQLVQAAEEGTLRRGTLARRVPTTATSIRLDAADIAIAKAQAEKRGIRYQTYLKMIIHQALADEAATTLKS